MELLDDANSKMGALLDGRRIVQGISDWDGPLGLSGGGSSKCERDARAGGARWIEADSRRQGVLLDRAFRKGYPFIRVGCAGSGDA